MEWTQEDVAELQKFTTTIDSDDIKIKEQIKQMLLNNRFIIHVLNNKELEEVEAEPDEYYNVNILPYYLLAPTQTNVQNFICFEVVYEELMRYNASAKRLNIIFHILCHHDNITDEDTGIARHDLLAALIQHDFNFTNNMGKKLKLVADQSRPVDNMFISRTLTFEQITDNNLVKTYNDNPRLANKF